MKTALIGKEMVAEGTMRFRFEKPEGYAYRAGQSIDLTIPHPPENDAEGSMRAFTMASAPQDPYLAITTRMRDTAFKRSLKQMLPGAPLSFEGPFGDLTLHEKAERPAIFLAGGIGITPFYSMIRDATERNLPHRITLFYSNRRPEDAAFLAELQKIPQTNKNFSLVATMTDMTNSAQQWDGERGYINKGMLEKYGALSGNPLFYLAGPAAMVAALRKTLNDSGVSNDDIRTEEFTGY
jgi:ferredoxin-NADP reductase